MRRRRRGATTGGDRGTSSLELVAAVPLLLLFASFALQAGADVFVTVSAQEAARQGARAASLGQDGPVAARAALPGPLRLVSASVIGPSGHGVRVVVEAPRLAPLPTFTATREAVLP